MATMTATTAAVATAAVATAAVAVALQAAGVGLVLTHLVAAAIIVPRLARR